MYRDFCMYILKTKMAVRRIKLVSQTLEITTENKPEFFHKAPIENHDVLLQRYFILYQWVGNIYPISSAFEFNFRFSK